MSDPRRSSTFARLPRGTETILLVDDEPSVRGLARTILTGCGYRVRDTGDPRDALAIIEREGPGYGLLLTDIIMPGMRGGVLAERITSICPSMQVLLMSGFPADLVLTCPDGSRRNFLPTPFTPQSLAHAVREALDKGRGCEMSPARV